MPPAASTRDAPQVPWICQCGTRKDLPTFPVERLEALVRTSVSLYTAAVLHVRAPTSPHPNGHPCALPAWYVIRPEVIATVSRAARARISTFLDETYPHGAYDGTAIPPDVHRDTVQITANVSLGSAGQPSAFTWEVQPVPASGWFAWLTTTSIAGHDPDQIADLYQRSGPSMLDLLSSILRTDRDLPRALSALATAAR